MLQDWLGIDFGTSNSAVACLENGSVRRIDVEGGSETIPTTVFFDFETGELQFGSAADACLTGAAEGRYMRSLKSVLGTSLMAEKRVLMGREWTFFEIISAFLVYLKSRAESQTGRRFANVVAGRPVKFHSDDPKRNAQALEDLRQCYALAGFESIVFVAEPEAAATANRRVLKGSAPGLVVDIGGGTSDFTLFSLADQEPKEPHPQARILASHGVRAGGNDFDKAINFNRFMPFLGKGLPIRKALGSGTVTAPNSIYAELATWELIPFLYDRKTALFVRDLIYHAVDRAPFRKLQRIIELQLGHELSFLAETAKISANANGQAATVVKLDLIEEGLECRIAAEEFAALMEPFSAAIEQAIGEVLELAQCPADRIGNVIFVGGSSLMGIILQVARERFPDADFQQENVFTSVVDGLALSGRSGVSRHPAGNGNS